MSLNKNSVYCEKKRGLLSVFVSVLGGYDDKHVFNFSFIPVEKIAPSLKYNFSTSL